MFIGCIFGSILVIGCNLFTDSNPIGHNEIQNAFSNI